MKTYILAMDGVLASSIVDPMDALSIADRFYLEMSGAGSKPVFNTKIVSLHGQPIECANNMQVTAHCSINEIDKADLLIVSAFYDIEQTLIDNGELVEWLQKMHQKGCTIASVCTGAFLLAEAGLLDGKTATTHLSAAFFFQSRYPKVKLDKNRIITDEGNVICSGGASSSLDLSFFLVEKYMNHQVAAHCSRFFVRDLRRHSQAPYSEFKSNRLHGDSSILKCQQWLDQNFEQEITTANLAKQSNMSKRTFERRFKKATGETPLTYLQKTRVKNARELLETTEMSFDEISYKVGYNNVSSFRKVFLRHTHLLPLEYRNRFCTKRQFVY